MTFFSQNLIWMAQNAMLAFVPIILVIILRKKLNTLLYILLFFLWLIFLPNSVYLITDLQHLPNQLIKAKDGEQLLLLIQYAILASLGIMTYAYSLEPISNVFKRLRLPEVRREILYIFINYIIAFGVMVGKFQRTHSWYIFTNPAGTFNDLLKTLTSIELLGWVFVFGSIVNILFFLFREYFPPLREKKK